MPVNSTFKVCTPEAKEFVDRHHYLAGMPFVADINDDFTTDAEQRAQEGSGSYRATRNEALALANARFICRAANSHDDLVRDMSDAITELELCRAVLKDYARGVKSDPDAAIRRVKVAGDVAENMRATLARAEGNFFGRGIVGGAPCRELPTRARGRRSEP